MTFCRERVCWTDPDDGYAYCPEHRELRAGGVPVTNAARDISDELLLTQRPVYVPRLTQREWEILVPGLRRRLV